MIHHQMVFILCAIPLSLMGMEKFCCTVEQEFPGLIPKDQHAKIIRRVVSTLKQERERITKSPHPIQVHGTSEDLVLAEQAKIGGGHIELKRLSWLIKFKGVDPNCPDDENTSHPLLYRYANDAATEESGFLHHLIAMLVNGADPLYAVGKDPKHTLQLMHDEPPGKYYDHAYQLLRSFSRPHDLEVFDRAAYEMISEIDHPEAYLHTLTRYFPVGIPTHIRKLQPKSAPTVCYPHQIGSLNGTDFYTALVDEFPTTMRMDDLKKIINNILDQECKVDAVDKIRSAIDHYNTWNDPISQVSYEDALADVLHNASFQGCTSKDLSRIAVLLAAGARSINSKGVLCGPFKIINLILERDQVSAENTSIVLRLLYTMTHVDDHEDNK